MIRLDGVTKRFGAVTALDRVDLDVGEGEFVCLLGPSGCGKSTLLRCIAGFEEPDEGRVVVDGRDLAGEPPHRRPVNMMFQFYALFPHLTVARNVGYGLAHLPRRERAARVAELLATVQLDAVAARYPAQLSGGQRQRVALARSLARRPRTLLLDEPLGALDRRLRERTQGELKALQARLGTTFLMVTHDQGEAMTLADRIAIFDGGRLVQAGTPRALYERPATRFVAGFLGDVAWFEGRVVSGGEGSCAVALDDGGGVLAAVAPAPRREGERVAVAIRPERMRVVREEDGAPPGVSLPANVTEAAFLGPSVGITVRLADGRSIPVSRTPGEGGPESGSVRLVLPDGVGVALP